MLDIAAFLNALRDGRVSSLEPLALRPFLDADGGVVSFGGEDALVVPLTRDRDTPEFALRLPLEPAAARRWPVLYADIAAAPGAIQAHLPQELTILDVDDIPGTGIALLHDWVPGETLTSRVTRARARDSRDRLAELLWPLAEVGEALRLSGMVHGDIAPGNLILRPDGGITLVDLDRMGYRDAERPPSPRRRAGYRLPRGGGSPVAEDAFALLVLLTSCSMLADSSVPIDHERAPAESHPALLFSSWDLMDLQRSRLVRELAGEVTTVSTELLDLLVAASSHPDRAPALLRDATRLIRQLGVRPDPDLAGEARSEPWTPVPARVPPRAERPAADPAWGAGWPTPPEDDPEPEPEPEPSAPEPTWPDRPAPLPAPPAEPGWRSSAQLVEALRRQPVPAVTTSTTGRRQARAERRRAEVADRLQRALRANDRAELVNLAMSGSLAELGESDRADVLRVVRALAHDSLQRAIATDDDAAIVAAVDESVFATDLDLDPAFRDRVRVARDRERWADRLVEAARAGDGRECAVLLNDAPEEAERRLPDAVHRQARRLAERHEARTAVDEALRHGHRDRLARALGRFAAIHPTWTDDVETAAVISLLGPVQIERRLTARLAAREVAREDQWMIDLVIAAGRLPEVTRLAGLTPAEASRLIHRPFEDGASQAP